MSSPWSVLAEMADNTILGTYAVPATFHPQGFPDVDITGIIKAPSLDEEQLPGSASGVNTVRFFVRWVDITPSPKIGDRITLNGVLYNVYRVSVDESGGALLILQSLTKK